MQPGFAHPHAWKNIPTLEDERDRVDIDGGIDPQGRRKNAWERRWEDALARFLLNQRGRIRERIAEQAPAERKAAGDAVGLDADFWDAEERELVAVLMELLTEMSADSAVTMGAIAEADFGIGLDWTQANTRAAKWARQQANKLTRGITETTRNAMAQDIAAWIERPGATVGELFQRLESEYAFSPNRARAIATTETTSAYAEGNAEVARDLAGAGFEIQKTWHTNEDDLVCPLCSPLNGEVVVGVDNPYSDGTQRPARHTRCRCWETYSVVEGA